MKQEISINFDAPYMTMSAHIKHSEMAKKSKILLIKVF